MKPPHSCSVDQKSDSLDRLQKTIALVQVSFNVSLKSKRSLLSCVSRCGRTCMASHICECCARENAAVSLAVPAFFSRLHIRTYMNLPILVAIALSVLTVHLPDSTHCTYLPRVTGLAVLHVLDASSSSVNHTDSALPPATSTTLRSETLPSTPHFKAVEYFCLFESTSTNSQRLILADLKQLLG